MVVMSGSPPMSVGSGRERGGRPSSSVMLSSRRRASADIVGSLSDARYGQRQALPVGVADGLLRDEVGDDDRYDRGLVAHYLQQIACRDLRVRRGVAMPWQ